jgi:DNA-binding beta-propeller fold protein YncE
MRHIMALVLWLITTSVACAQGMAFTIPEKDLIPEGIAHDPMTNKLYVSSTFKRKIIEIDMSTGKSKEFIREGQDEIPGVLGMRIDSKRRHLWACAATAGEAMPVRGLEEITDQTGLYQYDLSNGKLLMRYTLDRDTLFHFINDVVISPDGNVYVTDTGAGKIYRASDNGKLDVVFSFEGYYPNGIDITDDGDLVIAVYGKPTGLVRLNPKTKAWSLFELPSGEQVGADGLYFHKNSLIAIQPSSRERMVAVYSLRDKHVVDKIQTIVDSNHAALSQPTTGVIIAGEFYFIANSQLQHFRKLFKTGTYSMDALNDVVILKVKLP